MTFETVLVRPRLHHVPPMAIALAVLLHVAAAAMLWWLAPARPEDPEREPIMLWFDSSPSNKGVQEPEKPGPPAPSPTATSETPPESPHEPPPQRPTEPPQAKAEPPASFPVLEFSIPPVTEPPPAPTSRDFFKPVPPPPRTAQRMKPSPPRPSPQRPPAELPATMPSPVAGPEPGDVLAGRGRQRNDYLSHVFRHLEPYRVNQAGGNRTHGRVVTRVTLARDGRLIDARIDTSSGSSALDAAELAAIRKASPFPPVPANMPGDPVILVLPINY